MRLIKLMPLFNKGTRVTGHYKHGVHGVYHRGKATIGDKGVGKTITPSDIYKQKDDK